MIKKKGVCDYGCSLDCEKCEHSCNVPHLCKDCKNCSGILCQKVYDKDADIDRYPFITEGIQYTDEFGTVKRLVVTECKNFVAEETDRGPVVSIIKKKKLMESLEDFLY